ncbi:phosphatase PAP2 family protein [Thauera butanivorans]|uniref:phosphatase PAP2 family protein n=1 Tax=Thauera butanivorans TaxID=86174 RepID=UPI0008396B08|nr:phosphatase PAP2 family protein [Thauera butanivorans]
MKFLRTWLEPRILAVVLLLASAAWIFIAVADEVADGDTVTLDRAIMLALHPRPDTGGPMWLQSAARDATALGSTTVLSLLVCMAVLFLLLSGRRGMALFVLASTLGGTLLSTLLKGAFSRPRPDVIPHGDFVTSASFPSGHAMMSAVVYLTLGVLLARLVNAQAQKLYIMGAALFLSGIVGLSRVYLGVHWPTDVLAGWAAGAAWALGWWMVAELMWRRRG